MFGFLKDKLKKAIASFGNKVEELPQKDINEESKTSLKKDLIEEPKIIDEPAREIIVEKERPEIITKEPSIQEKNIAGKKIEMPISEEKTKLDEYKPNISVEENKGFFDKIKDKFRKEEVIIKGEDKSEELNEKKGFFDKIKEAATTKKISDKDFDEMFYDLELALLESNVAYIVVEKIKEDLKKDIVDKPIKRSDVDEIIEKSLKKSIESLFDVENINLLNSIKNKSEKPFVIVFVGVNGVGKTSSIAKIAYYLKKNNISCIMAAADTWRAASIEQLEYHANKIGVKIIKHDYGSDPTAVSYDAVAYAKSKGIDVVLIDTAGRQHSNANLISEMQKIIRVIKPDLKIFVGESITGSDCIEQAISFNEAIGIDGIILSKADIDEKGGAAISMEYIIKKPIIYVGTGQELNDLTEFSKEKIISSIGL